MMTAYILCYIMLYNVYIYIYIFYCFLDGPLVFQGSESVLGIEFHLARRGSIQSSLMLHPVAREVTSRSHEVPGVTLKPLLFWLQSSHFFLDGWI